MAADLQFVEKLPQGSQSQASLAEQLCELIPYANRLGLYDASDYLVRLVGEQAKPPP